MPSPDPYLANAITSTRDFLQNFFAGALEGQFFPLLVLAILGLIVLRFTVARWLFTLIKQCIIFGGLGFAVWFGAHEIGGTYGERAGQAVLYIGGAVVLGLFFIMLYMFFLRRAREKEMIARGVDPATARKRAIQGRTTMRVGAGPLAGQGLPVHYEKAAGATATGAGGGSGGGTSSGGGVASATGGDHEMSKMEETLRKLNILGAAKEQNLLTVAVLILVAQFGVFTSRTISAPDHQVGLFLFLIFIGAAVIFIKTAYKNYMKGITHFAFAIIFAFILSAVMLVYWQQRFLCGDFPSASAITSACVGADATHEVPITWGIVMNPQFYFASDGLIAAITGVAFSTLLTKGGG